MNTSCIRTLADPVQINDCKETLDRMEENLTTTAKIFNLAGNEIRMKILFLLQKEEKLCPCDLSDILSITVGGVSQHLRKLKDGNLVKDKKVGQTVYYSLLKENVTMVLPVLQNLLTADIKESTL